VRLSRVPWRGVPWAPPWLPDWLLARASGGLGPEALADEEESVDPERVGIEFGDDSGLCAFREQVSFLCGSLVGEVNGDEVMCSVPALC